MNYSNNHYMIAIGSDAKPHLEDERELEGMYLFDRDEEARESVELDEDEYGDEHFVTHKGSRGASREKVIWGNLTDDDPE